MSYVATKHPGGRLPGQGWAPGLRGYVKTSTPGGKLPGQGWLPGMRGFLGALRKPVFGCACDKPSQYLGDADDGSDSGVVSDPNIYDLPGLNIPVGTTSNPNPYDLPGLTSGPVYPGGSAAPTSQYTPSSNMISSG